MCQRTLGERLGMKSRPKGGGRWMRANNRLVGQEATEITDQLRLGAKPDTVKSAIRVRVEEG